jgi:hypothetical protein
VAAQLVEKGSGDKSNSKPERNDSNASVLVANVTANLTALAGAANRKWVAVHDSLAHPGVYEFAVLLGCLLVMGCYCFCRYVTERPQRDKDYVTLPLITIRSGQRR